MSILRKHPKLYFLLILSILLASSTYAQYAQAATSCSKNGYTVLTINGIFTDEKGANYNAYVLGQKLNNTYKGENITLDYVYNPSHLAGIADLIDTVRQGAFDEKSDYDLVEMEKYISARVATQKLLLVGYSQGNFYSNNLYDSLADKSGGVPSQSLGVYSVGTPASVVVGKGRYLTSDSDKIINEVVGRAVTVLKPNVHIDLQSGDDTYGHSFSDVYMKYQGDRIISDLHASLDTLSTNDTQNIYKPCINPPKVSLAHKIIGLAYRVGDYVAMGDKNFILAINKGLHPKVSGKANTASAVALSGIKNTPPVVKTVKVPEPTLVKHIVLGDPIITTHISTPDIETVPVVKPIKPEILSEKIIKLSAPSVPLLSTNSSPIITSVQNIDPQPTTSAADPDPIVSDPVIPEPVVPDPIVQATPDVTTTPDPDPTPDSLPLPAPLIPEILAPVYDYTYIPKYRFGDQNGDGHDWQVWSFNGSNMYDWSDTYVKNYLHEQFKIQTYSGGFYASSYLARGVFNHDPRIGFNRGDVEVSGLESDPQNSGIDATYDVDIEWDATGYVYTISHAATIDATGHTDVPDVSKNTWVGWDTTYNEFRTFPSGDWQGVPHGSPYRRTGGSNMTLEPYPVYVPSSSSPSSDPTLPADPSSTPNANGPTLTSFTLNNSAADISANPSVSPVSISLTASESVNWLSLKIENQDDLTKFKTLQSGATCVDGTSTCTKIWDGSLSSGGNLVNGTYRIKVHMKNAVGTEYNDYLPIVITVHN